MFEIERPRVDSRGLSFGLMLCRIHLVVHLGGNVRTNIVLDDELIQEALAATGARTKREVVHLALQELVRSRTKKNLLDLAGRVRFREDFDYKAMRKLRG
jgi:Arc/MetJ family transcription regulator